MPRQRLGLLTTGVGLGVHQVVSAAQVTRRETLALGTTRGRNKAGNRYTAA
jgi:hypothetical protein